jgi:hypothetical protein
MSSLRKITEILEIAVFYFLADDKGKNHVVISNEKKKIRFSEFHMTMSYYLQILIVRWRCL